MKTGFISQIKKGVVIYNINTFDKIKKSPLRYKKECRLKTYFCYSLTTENVKNIYVLTKYFNVSSTFLDSVLKIVNLMDFCGC